MADALVLLKKLRNEKRLVSSSSSLSLSSSSVPVLYDSPSVEKNVQKANDDNSSSIIFQPSRRWDIGSKTEENALIIYEDSVGLSQAGNGATLWDCSMTLTRFLEFKKFDWSEKNVIELGAGVGLISMSVAALGAKVTATERSIMIPILKHNIEKNQMLNESVGLHGYVAAVQRNDAQKKTCGSSCLPPAMLTSNKEPDMELPPSSINPPAEGSPVGTSKVASPVVPLVQKSTSTADGLLSTSNSNHRDENVSVCENNKSGTCVVMELEWNHFINHDHCAKQIHYDVVLAADIVFPSNSDNFEVLVETLCCLFHSNKVPPPLSSSSSSSRQSDAFRRVVGWMTYESRNKEVEARFWKMLNSRNIQHQQMIVGKDFPLDLPCYSPDICIFKLFSVGAPGILETPSPNI